MQNTTTILVIVLIVLLAVVLLGGAGMMGFGGFGMGPGMMSGNGMMGGQGMMGAYGSYGYNPLSTFLSLAFWGLILGGGALLAVYLVRNNNKSTPTSNPSSLDIQKTRYARGEISKEQFDAIKRDLGV